MSLNDSARSCVPSFLLVCRRMHRRDAAKQRRNTCQRQHCARIAHALRRFRMTLDEQAVHPRCRGCASEKRREIRTTARLLSSAGQLGRVGAVKADRWRATVAAKFHQVAKAKEVVDQPPVAKKVPRSVSMVLEQPASASFRTAPTISMGDMN